MNHPLKKQLRFFAAAVCFFSTAAAMPEDPELAGEGSNLVTRAYDYFEAGQPERALEAFNKALKEDGANLTARLGQAMVFLEQQRHEEAFDAYSLVVQGYPGHAFAWNGRGLAAFNLEDFDEALRSFQQATADQPVNGFFYESLAWTELCRGDYAKAARTAKQATLMYHQNGETAAYPLLIAYFSYWEAGQKEAARRTLNYARNNKPADNAWPAPVFEYLSGRLSAAELISFVTDSAQETEAHAYIGLKLRLQGEADQAKTHLNWVAAKGDTRVFEHTLARTLQIPEKVALLTP